MSSGRRLQESSGTHFCSLEAPTTANPGWLTMDFRTPVAAATVRVQMDPNSDDRVVPYDVEIQASNDGRTWTSLASVREFTNKEACGFNDIELKWKGETYDVTSLATGMLIDDTAPAHWNERSSTGSSSFHSGTS